MMSIHAHDFILVAGRTFVGVVEEAEVEGFGECVALILIETLELSRSLDEDRVRQTGGMTFSFSFSGDSGSGRRPSTPQTLSSSLMWSSLPSSKSILRATSDMAGRSH